MIELSFFGVIHASLIIPLLFCMGCSQSEENKLKQDNLKGEFIYRRDVDRLITPSELHSISGEPYPWEKADAGMHPSITKDFFRCKGSPVNPPRIIVKKNGEKIYCFDCGGGAQHSLPLRNGKEFIYPVLIELLNYLQAETGKKAAIACGHRCPDHHVYVNPTSSNRSPKYMMGAQVSFNMEGMEDRPESVVALIIDFYKSHPQYKGLQDFTEFKRYEKPDTDVTTPPWFNKEIFIKLYKSDEGRDLDHSHRHPYISIQVRFDRNLNEKVQYSWEKAKSNYLRN